MTKHENFKEIFHRDVVSALSLTQILTQNRISLFLWWYWVFLPGFYLFIFWFQ